MSISVFYLEMQAFQFATLNLIEITIFTYKQSSNIKYNIHKIYNNNIIYNILTGLNN